MNLNMQLLRTGISLILDGHLTQQAGNGLAWPRKSIWPLPGRISRR